VNVKDYQLKLIKKEQVVKIIKYNLGSSYAKKEKEKR
jgi:hypothetical protein